MKRSKLTIFLILLAVLVMCNGLISLAVGGPNNCTEVSDGNWTIDNEDFVGTFDSDTGLLVISQVKVNHAITFYDPRESTCIQGSTWNDKVVRVKYTDTAPLPAEVFSHFTVVKRISCPNLASSNGAELKYNDSLETIIFEEDLPILRAIPNDMFSGNTGLMSVDLGSNITSIGDNAFKDCTNLRTVTDGTSVTSIGNNAFLHCSLLNEVTVSNKLKTIGACAFQQCTNLDRIRGMAGVASFGADCFNGCVNMTLEKQFESDDKVDIGARAFAGALAVNDANKFVFKGGVDIGDSAFEGAGVNTVDLYGQSSRIGNQAFASSKITRVMNAGGVTSIGEDAFNNAIMLSEFVPGSSLESIGSSAFDGCERLSSRWETMSSTLTTIPDYCFRNTKLSAIDLSNITSVGDEAFKGTSLDFITSNKDNPLVFTHIGDEAFAGIVSTPIDDLIVEISGAGNDIFKGSTILGNNIDLTIDVMSDQLFMNNTGLTNVTITSAGISDEAFKGCANLQSVTLTGAGAHDIGVNAFNGCIRLKDVTGVIGTVGNNAFTGLQNLVNIDLSTATSIGDEAFKDCNRLQEVNLNAVTSIGSDAFENCTSLLNFTINPTFAGAGTNWYGAFKLGSPTQSEINVPISCLDVAMFEEVTNRKVTGHTIELTARYEGPAVRRDPETQITYPPKKEDFSVGVMESYKGPGVPAVTSDRYVDIDDDTTWTVDSAKFEKGVTESVTITYTTKHVVGFTDEKLTASIDVRVATTGIKEPLTTTFNRIEGSYPSDINEGEVPAIKDFQYFIIYDATFNDGTTGEWKQAAASTGVSFKENPLAPVEYPYTDYEATWYDTEAGVDRDFTIRVNGKCMHPEASREDCNIVLPTCTETGHKEIKCSVCGTIILNSYVEIDALGHDLDDGVHTDKEDDPDGIGFTTYHCKRCGDTLIHSDADQVRPMGLKIYYGDIDNKTTVDKMVGEKIIPDDFCVKVILDMYWSDGTYTREEKTLNKGDYELKLSDGSVFDSAYTIVEGANYVHCKCTYLDEFLEEHFTFKGNTEKLYSLLGYMQDNNGNDYSDYCVYVDTIDNMQKINPTSHMYKFDSIKAGTYDIWYAKNEVTDLSDTNSDIVCKLTVEFGSMVRVVYTKVYDDAYSVNTYPETPNIRVDIRNRTKTGSVRGTWRKDINTNYTGRYIFMDNINTYCVADIDGSWQFSDVGNGTHKIYLTDYTSLPKSRANDLGVEDARIISIFEIVTDMMGNSTMVTNNDPNTSCTVIANTGDLYLAFVDAPKTTTGKGIVSGTITNHETEVDGAIYFIDSSANSKSMDKDGYYLASELEPGEHVIYFTDKTSLKDVNIGNGLDKESYLILYVNVDNTGKTTYKASNIIDKDVKFSEDKTEQGNALQVNFTIGEKQDPGPIVVTSGFRLTGQLASKNGLFANRAILLDSYDNWTIGDSSGTFYFDNVEDSGTHILYVCKSVKSKLLGDSGPVSDDEPLFEKIQVVMHGSTMTPEVKALESEDYVSHSYSWQQATYDQKTGQKRSDAVLTLKVDDNSTQPTTKEGVDLNGQIQSENFNVASKAVLLDSYDNWTVISSGGAFGFSEISEGQHELYITKVTRSNLKKTTGAIARNEELLAVFSFKVESGVFKDISIVECEDTVSWSHKLSQKLDVMDLTVNDAPSDITAKPSIEGSIDGEDLTRYSGRAVLIDTYDNWTTIDSNGYFMMSDIEDGDHTIYVTTQKKSDLKKQSGKVLSSEKCLIQLRLIVENGIIKSTSVIESPDMVFMKYQIKDNMCSYEITDDTKYAEIFDDKATVMGTISGEDADRYTSRVVLLDNYDNWVTMNSSGEFQFDEVSNGSHMIYVTKAKKSELKHGSGNFDKDESCYIKIKLTIEDNKIKSTSIVESEDDVTMKYEIDGNTIEYTITDAKVYGKDKDSDKDTGKSDGKGDGKGDGSSSEDEEIPVAFSMAYVHDGRPATGCYLFLDDILHNKAIPNNGYQYMWVPEGLHTLYVTAVDPGTIVLTGGDLATSKYLLYQITFDNQDGHIMSVTEDKAVKGSIHNLKLSPKLNSLGLAMITVSPLSTAVDLGNGPKPQTPAESVESSTSSEESTSTSTSTSGGTKSETTTTVTEEEETFSIGDTDIVTSQLPQTGYDYLMTVAADNGMIRVDENANAYLDVNETIDYVRTLDTPEAKEFIADLNGRYLLIAFAAIIFVLSACVFGFYTVRSNKRS